MSRIRRILHPTDFSKASSAAYKRAVEMAKSNRAELLLVHVLTPAIPMVADGYISPQVYEDMANADARLRPEASGRARPEGEAGRARGSRGCCSTACRTSASRRPPDRGRPTWS